MSDPLLLLRYSKSWSESDMIIGMGGGDVMQANRWVESWRKAGPRLEAIRRRELKSVDTMRALMNLAGAFEFCRLHFKPSSTSGLVIQQKYFKALRT